MIDLELEKAIDEVGRDRVFHCARKLGWGNHQPPKYVWWSIIAELRQNK